MSTHYLVSLFDDTIVDVVSPQGPPETRLSGQYVVRVPDEITVREPDDLDDLLTKKYTSLLGSFGLFTQIEFDDMLDATGVDPSTSSNVQLGVRGNVALLPGGVLRSTVSPLSWGGPGSGPSQALLTWEVFTYADLDPSTAVYQRRYLEIPTGGGDVTARVSFNGGTTFASTSDKALLSIGGSAQGSSLVVEFTHAGAADERLFLGSWAVLF
jgi:hypothetical protein